MKEYDITIAETLKKTVTVEAENSEEAQEIVEDRWRDGEYVLDAESFSEVDYFVEAERDVPSVEAEKINVLLIKPGRFPQEVQIGLEYEELRKAVGGRVQVTYPFEELVGIICNEDAKYNGMPPNRAMRDMDGKVYDIIVGDFLVVGLTEDDFCSLTPEQVKFYEERFHCPETFLKMGQRMLIVPIPDENVRRQDSPKGQEPKQKKPQDKEL
ncbi:MAG: DUF3846 domain-containing protein [Lachnospiraceae bacterium]|nr:DUF3846 domain-containing protein [Lachnospiraceae bacterium]